MGQERPIAVIGSGLGGLAAAVVSAARGHKVEVFDKNDWLGGKAAVLNENGFRFDMGPTILTVPSVLRRIFSEAGEKLEDWLELIRLDPQWRCFFNKGERLDLVEDIDIMAKSAEAFAARAASRKAIANSKKCLPISTIFPNVSFSGRRSRIFAIQ